MEMVVYRMCRYGVCECYLCDILTSMTNFSIFLLMMIVASCSSVRTKFPSDQASSKKIKNLDEILDRAEDNASPEGKAILTTARSMIEVREVVVGSCWDYINTVFNRADFPAKKRKIVLKGKKKGPFAGPDQIQAGDWLYYINHSYSRVEHSGVFVEWMNREKKSALVMSYQGGKNKSPATYKVYDLKNVYYIIRPQ